MLANDVQDNHRGLPHSRQAKACSDAFYERQTSNIERRTSNDEIASHELGRLPEDHLHCARLAINTLGEAIAEYHRKALANRRKKDENNCISDISNTKEK